MILIKNLCKSFSNKTIFRDFNLEVSTGEFIGIYGKSGQGKSTLLNIIGAIEDPDSGEIKIMGYNIKSKKTKRILLKKYIGFIFQNYALFDNGTVYENLEVALKHKKMNKTKRRELISAALKEVNLVGFEKEKIHNLSGGEQQRVSFARLLLKDPYLILADEPSGSLDNVNRDLIFSLFKELHQKGKTIIVVTHDPSLSHYFSRTIHLI